MKKFLAMILIVSTLAMLLSVPALAKSANVRSGPGLTYKKLGTLTFGTKVTVYATKKDSRGVTWCKVKYKSGYGWVSSRYVTGYSGQASGGSSSKSGGVRAVARTYVRKGPGTSYKVVAEMYQGDRASYLGSTKKDYRGVKWYKVRYSGITGWVSSRYTTK